MSVKNVRIFLGNIIHCSQPFRICELEKGYVIVQQEKILAIGEESNLPAVKRDLHLRDNDAETIVLSSSQLLIPGFIDTHIHGPQYPNVGLGYDVTLLDWLQTYTYALEKKFVDRELAIKVFNAVVKKTLKHGTTTACYFASLFEEASRILADAALTNGQRALIGKINMIKLAPEDYTETREDSIASTKKFVSYVKSKKNELVKAVITPRFALSVDMQLMRDLAKIAAEEDLHVQTHISENKDEVKLVESEYNSVYAKVYDEAGLLTSKTVLAHGIYLSDEELTLLANRGSSIAHCPDSNTCLKSGLCDVRRLLEFGVKVGLGTDVSGGSTPSIVKAMKSALDTSVHISLSRKDYEPLNYQDVFYLATLGGAEALALDNQIGNFATGKYFDALIVDMAVQGGAVDHLIPCSPLELLQTFIYSGDDRNIVQVYVAGKRVFSNSLVNGVV